MKWSRNRRLTSVRIFSRRQQQFQAVLNIVPHVFPCEFNSHPKKVDIQLDMYSFLSVSSQPHVTSSFHFPTPSTPPPNSSTAQHHDRSTTIQKESQHSRTSGIVQRHQRRPLHCTPPLHGSQTNVPESLHARQLLGRRRR